MKSYEPHPPSLSHLESNIYLDSKRLATAGYLSGGEKEARSRVNQEFETTEANKHVLEMAIKDAIQEIEKSRISNK